MSRPPQAPGVSLAGRENRVGLGLGAGPSLPPGVGFGSGVPRAATGANLNGAMENTGNAGASSAIAAILKSMGSAGGTNPGKGSRGPRGIEKPSLGRSGAISRRLNGNPSRGTELKGL